MTQTMEQPSLLPEVPASVIEHGTWIALEDLPTVAVHVSGPFLQSFTNLGGPVTAGHAYRPLPGQLHNIVLGAVIDGQKNVTYSILAGRRRVAAARALKCTHIRADVYDLAPETNVARLITIIENEQRSQNVAAEYEAYTKLVKDGATYRQIADATGAKIPTIKRVLRYAQLDATLREALFTNKIAQGTADRLLTLGPQYQALAVGVLQEKGKLKWEDVEALTHQQTAAGVQALGGLGDLLGTPPAPKLGVALDVTYVAEQSHAGPDGTLVIDQAKLHSINLIPADQAVHPALVMQEVAPLSGETSTALFCKLWDWVVAHPEVRDAVATTDPTLGNACMDLYHTLTKPATEAQPVAQKSTKKAPKKAKGVQPPT